MEGWIKIHRKILDWEWYDNLNTRVLFMHLLLTVNFEHGSWQGHDIWRGQRITSIRKLAKECGLSIKSIRVALEHLKTTQEVAHEGHGAFSLFTVLKYDDYQDRGTINGQVGAKSGQSKGNNIRIKRIKEEEEIKKEEFGDKSPTPSQKMIDFVTSVTYKDKLYYELLDDLEEKWKVPSENLSAELDKFVSYWTELNGSGKKQRWEMQKVFEVQRRLSTWFQNANKYSMGGRSEQPKGIRVIS